MITKTAIAPFVSVNGRDEEASIRPMGRPLTDILDEGPFFHGTVADLRVGDLLVAGYRSNYRPEVIMNHIYFTALADGAGLAAEIAADLSGGRALQRVYAVKPTGHMRTIPT